VLAWYRRERGKRVRADALETAVLNDKVLVGPSIFDDRSSSESSSQPHSRWQILKVKNGLVVDIRGFDDRNVAISRKE
jgi:hypothetical protein